MNPDHFKQLLLAKEHELSARVGRAIAGAREVGDDSPHDVGDESVTDELKEQQLTEAEADQTVLTQVREALKRINDGTFGKCVVDGGPIEDARLEAVPWTPYCLKHQQLREETGSTRTPTL
jgi:RNA polymerase-binding transcription factor